MLTQERLKELLHYDQETGTFTWKKTFNNQVKSGNIAGNIRKDGRRQIEIFSKSYLEHRLAWLYLYGEMPKNHIDHINGNPIDNRISNLRDVDRFCNQQNQMKKHKNTKSGMMGAYKNKKGWKSSIMANGKRIYLGTFKTKELANTAYLNAKCSLHKDSFIAQALKDGYPVPGCVMTQSARLVIR